MAILDKVKSLFEAQKMEDVIVKVFVKAKDGKIFSIKGKELAVDAEILLVNEDATETAVENGDYVLEDESTITVLDGKVTVITPKVEEEEPKVKMSVIKQVSKWTLDIDQDAIELGTIVTQTYKDNDGNIGEPCPIQSGEYEMENGDKIQVDANGKVVLITKVGEDIEPVKEVNVETEEMKAVKAELEAVKLEKDNLEKEAALVKAAFEKLKNEPATAALDVRKFEKTEIVTKKDLTMLDKVKNITR